MQRFTRIHTTSKDGATRPQSLQSRVYGESVSVGEPLRLDGDAEMRLQVETSLEALAKERLLEADRQASEIVEQAKIEAAGLLQRANAQSAEMLSITQSEVDGIREAAHEEGFKAGFQEGYADATEQVERETVELLQGAQVLAEGAYTAEKRVLKEFEKHAAQLIEHIVRRILNRELSDSPELLLRMVDNAIESLYLSGKVKVVVSSQVIQDLRDFTEHSRDTLEAMSRFEFVADPGLDLHQIFIIGHEGSFDVSPEAQLQKLMTPIAKNLNLPRPEIEQPEVAAFQVPDPDTTGLRSSHDGDEAGMLAQEEIAEEASALPLEMPAEMDFEIGGFDDGALS